MLWKTYSAILSRISRLCDSVVGVEAMVDLVMPGAKALSSKISDILKQFKLSFKTNEIFRALQSKSEMSGMRL